MKLSENYIITGERYADAVLSKLIGFIESKYNISIDKFDPFYYGCNLEKYVELVYREFPLCMDTPNCPYDVEYCWNEFLNSKYGKSAEQWIKEHTFIDSAYFYDDLDKETIAETMDFVKDWVKEFASKNPIGKKLSSADVKCIIDTINNAEIGTFENGYAWGADEFVEIIMNDHDGSHNYNDVMKEENKFNKYIKEGKLLGEWFTSFNDEEVVVLYCIDLESLAKHALR